jgi:UDP:flavonoid glycosyltransferase YjiC (YdhE family)
MGSMFIWSQAEYTNLLQGLSAVHHSLQERVRFVLKVNRPRDGRPAAHVKQLPPFIRETNWVESQHSVFQHPALRVIVHHGGGNLFNEAVYFGVPQLILSQWLDTHELGHLATKFGFGLQSASPPHIDASDIHQKLVRLLGSDWTRFKSSANSWSIRSKLGGGATSAARVILAHAESQALIQNRDQKVGLVAI